MPKVAQRGSSYRIFALRIVQDALNFARSEIRRQATTGLEAPVAIQTHEQGGFAPLKIDAQLDRRIRHNVERLTPEVSYWSEESQPNLVQEENEVYAWCDPLDGTVNSFTLFGLSAVVLFYDWFYRGKVRHLAGAIAASTGEIVSWQHIDRGVGEVWVDWPSEYVWPGESPEMDQRAFDIRTDERPTAAYGVQVGETGDINIYPGKRQRIAAVATTRERAARLAADFDLASPTDTPSGDRPWLSNLGGNPVVAPLLLGELGGVIEVKNIALHDAAYLFPLTIARGVVADLSGEAIDVFDRFHSVHPEHRRIGPFVAAASKDTLLSLLETYRQPDMIDLRERTQETMQ